MCRALLVRLQNPGRTHMIRQTPSRRLKVVVLAAAGAGMLATAALAATSTAPRGSYGGLPARGGYGGYGASGGGFGSGGSSGGSSSGYSDGSSGYSGGSSSGSGSYSDGSGSG